MLAKLLTQAPASNPKSQTCLAGTALFPYQDHLAVVGCDIVFEIISCRDALQRQPLHGCGWDDSGLEGDKQAPSHYLTLPFEQVTYLVFIRLDPIIEIGEIFLFRFYGLSAGGIVDWPKCNFSKLHRIS